MSGWRELRLRFGADPRIDDATVGINFVDVLFAIVIGFALTPIDDWRDVPTAGWWHLAVAATLTLTSWVGYHNSANRLRFVIGFPNLPLLQFLLDIVMVVVYGLTVFSAEATPGVPGAPVEPSARPEAFLVLLAFVLYALWDGVGVLIRGAPAYRAAWDRALARRTDLDLEPMRARDDPADRRRRRVTVVGIALAAAVYVWATSVDGTDPAPSVAAVALVDAALIVLLVAYRMAKEVVAEPRTDDNVGRARGG